MGCPTQAYLGETVVVSIVTHSPDTAIQTDADSPPTYRVYEDETQTAILNGTMAKLDDANTTGFYSASILCSVGNGFEDSKTYTVYVEASVAGSRGGISYGFKTFTRQNGPGSQSFTYTLTNTVDGQPISAVYVWVTTDVAGNNTIASGLTNAVGQVVFFLDAGTYYFWSQKSGWNFTNPDQETV